MLIQVVHPIYSALLTVTIFSFVAISFCSYKNIGEKQALSNTLSQNANRNIIDALKNKPVIIAHGDEIKEFKCIENSSLTATKSAIDVVTFSQTISALQVILLGLGLTAITVLSASDLSGGIITLGDFVQINAYVLQFVIPVSYVGMVLSAVKRSSITIAENAEHLVYQDSTFNDPSSAEYLLPPTITFENVCVKSTEGRTLLKNISICISSGSSLAIVGQSGSGKSTFAKAILGLVEVHSGVIRVDSNILTNDTIRTLRDIVGYVPQETFLFDRSVKDNVFGNAFVDPNEMIKILKASGVDDYEIILECNSNSLSGGEKQRVSFARAIARHPGVIILDEPTSSLDKKTKSALSTAIYTILKDATRIIVTHDLEEASRAHNIMVLENGKISEYGNHAQLVESGGWYSKHWEANLVPKE